ncbi:MAG: YkgJ family cysteine cluster protein [Verrucomicrobiaceae bacterium]|nr:YkgJ family cysteine cluster protein [Verrucomicrobiaceae bacterium]
MPESSPLDSTGLRFLCQRCGNCCRWPGDVHVTGREISVIAEFLGISEHAFVQDYTRINARRTGLSIIDQPDGACIFLEGVNVCRIQAVKPEHCKGFPNAWNFPGWRDLCEAVEV